MLPNESYNSLLNINSTISPVNPDKREEYIPTTTKSIYNLTDDSISTSEAVIDHALGFLPNLFSNSTAINNNTNGSVNTVAPTKSTAITKNSGKIRANFSSIQFI